MFSRKESFKAFTAASLITILGMPVDFVAATDRVVQANQAISSITKSKADKINNQDVKITYSKSSEDAENIMKKQVTALKEAKYEEEKAEKERLEAEAEAERLRKEEEERRVLEEAQRQAELEREKENKSIERARAAISYAENDYNINIQSKSYWTREDFEAVLPDSLKPVIDTAIRMEEEQGINALYLVSVAANETGWGTKMSGNHNYFNWSIDGVKSLDFESMEEFTSYSMRGYKKFLKPEYYAGKLDDQGTIPDVITVKVVNTGYAFNPDKSVNWTWSEVVCKIIKQLTEKRNAIEN